jgi:hypothetical protein
MRPGAATIPASAGEGSGAAATADAEGGPVEERRHARMAALAIAANITHQTTSFIAVFDVYHGC